MKKFMLLIFFCPALYAHAQTEAEIRNHYQDVNNRILESIEHGFEGSLYCNEWITNKNSKSWPAVGIYQETTDFWYDDDPNHLPAEERDPKTVLLKVAIKRRSSALSTTEEYLYKNGKLVFYYSIEGEEGKKWETRAWFNAKGMFRSVLKADDKELSQKDLAQPEYRDFKLSLTNIRKYGISYQEQFTRSMGYR